MDKQIYPCVWFNQNAAEAAEFYNFAFSGSKILSSNPMSVQIQIEDLKFLLLNGGPMFEPNPSISYFVIFDTAEETQKCWDLLSESAQILMKLDKYDWSKKYGWLQDKFGISWQLSYGKLEEVGQRITSCLMFTQNFAGKAEEAMAFYTSIFEKSEISSVLKYRKEEEELEGAVKHAQFKLNNQVFMAMDSSASTQFKFSEGNSLVIECKNQEEIDYYWEKLTLNGSESRCGWLKDQFGVSWQVVPSIIGKLMNDPSAAQRVAQAFMQMQKLDIAELENAAKQSH